MISVIIPTADRPMEYLGAALDSVLAQTLQPSEILVMDNGRTPVDPARLPQGVTLVRLPPRVGPSRARNAGAAVARGTHLAFLDDDDWWEPGFLREAARVAEEGGFRIVYGRKDQSDDGVVTPHKTPRPDRMTVAVLLRRNPCTGGQNLYIEAALFARIGGFDERLRYAEDRALALEALLAGERIGCAPDAVAILRNHRGSRLRQHRARRARFVWKYRRLRPAREVASDLWGIGVSALRQMLPTLRPARR
ncbi:MAG: glycosyltransferase family 2 protein [Bauldia sp.]|nr:glycosyltransferase family 2 protein [Bauldia sp.]MCW5718398.1 glycosyltransferase family 2 protein [Bauldia sp.]